MKVNEAGGVARPIKIEYFFAQSQPFMEIDGVVMPRTCSSCDDKVSDF